MTQYDIYGKMAEDNFLSDILQNGRLHAQLEAEKFVPNDVIQKLHIRSEDRFLDIGCGLGLNLFPISERVAHAVGCDHPSVIEKLKSRDKHKDIELIGGNFMEVEFVEKFSKILAYSVIPALPSIKVVYTFIDRILDILTPDGCCLLGDLPNLDKKNRFFASKRGEKFQEAWQKLAGNNREIDDVTAYAEGIDGTSPKFDDEVLLSLQRYLRTRGYDAYIKPQLSKLPFGNTREDIIIYGPEFEIKA